MGINQLSKISFDVLISDEDSKDWYIYDYESICFLLKSEKMESTKTENTVIFKNNEIYFQDKLSYIDISLFQQHKQFIMFIMVNKQVKVS